MVDLDFTKLKVPVKKHDNCVVIDVSSGSFPRYIEVRMPGTDGARRTAIWDGLHNLSNNDKVMCEEYPGNPILRIVGFGGDQDAQSTTIWTRTSTEIDPTNDGDNVALYDTTPTKRIDLDPGTPATGAIFRIYDPSGDLKLEVGSDDAYRWLVSQGSTDVSQNILKVDVTGGPLLSWDESNDKFLWNKGQRLTAGDIGVEAGDVYADAHGFIVKNTSSATASAGDVGYLDENNEYQTTTTAEDEQANPVVVIVGGANNADIYVTKGPGRATLNYTGSAPSSGDFLEFSATAGSCQGNGTVMHPGVIARARANGSGGTVEAELLLRRETNTLASTTNALFIDGADGSDFVATISATGVSGDKVYYNAPSSGNVNTLTPSASTELIKVILHNTTQTEEAKVIATGSDGGGNFIQVSDSADVSGWVSTDAITGRSQTNTSLFTGTTYFYDLEVTSAEVPELATALLFTVRFWDTGSAGNPLGVHPYESNSNPKRKQTSSVGASGGASPDAERSMPLIQRRFCVAWDVSGSGTGSFRFRLDGARVAV